jgi:hypothetical protein
MNALLGLCNCQCLVWLPFLCIVNPLTEFVLADACLGPQVAKTVSHDVVALPATKLEGVPPTTRVFGRLKELACVARAAESVPWQVMLITGPPHSGKTALLKEFCKTRQHEGVCYIDCQIDTTGTPAGRLRSTCGRAFKWHMPKLTAV